MAVKTCASGRHQYEACRRMCPDCQKERHARWRAANRDHVREVNRRWVEGNYEKNREVQREYRASHRATRSEYDRQYRKDNPEIHALKEHRRRARKRGNGVKPFSVGQWQEIVAFYSGLCAYCGVKPWEHMDHVVSLASGGEHALSNQVPACAGCNHRKHTAEWPPRVRHPYMES